MLTVAEIRADYPTPSASPADDEYRACKQPYCVGGALCLYADIRFGRARYIPKFPDLIELTTALRKVNTTLRPDEANTYAEYIIEMNDAKEFEEAWQALDEALNRR